MLLSAAVNYPCQSWLVRHYGPWPAHSFTGPPPARNPLLQTALVPSSPAPGWAGPAASCLGQPGLVPPGLGSRRRRGLGGQGLALCPSRLPDAWAGDNEKTPTQQILGGWPRDDRETENGIWSKAF